MLERFSGQISDIPASTRLRLREEPQTTAERCGKMKIDNVRLAVRPSSLIKQEDQPGLMQDCSVNPRNIINFIKENQCAMSISTAELRFWL